MLDDLFVDEHPSCFLTFVQVGGEIDVIKRGCAIEIAETPVVGQQRVSENLDIKNQVEYDISNFTCKHDLVNDYETVCTCKTDFCNDSRLPLPTPPKPRIIDDRYRMVIDEVNRSIRQLRSDIKRTISEEVGKLRSCN